MKLLKFRNKTVLLSFIVIALSVLSISELQAQKKPVINSNTFGAIEARHLGPARMSGRVSAIDAVEEDSRIIYVGSASGGVWKSTNGGTSFKPVFDKHIQSIGAVAIDQNHPDTVWVGTGEPWTRNSVSIGGGVFKTTDGGETWKKLGLENTERIARIIVHPENSDTVYVAAMGHLWGPNEERGVYKTIDGGKTWEKVLYVDENTGCADITIDPREPETLYAGMWDFRRKAYTFRSGGKGSGLYKTTNGGKEWKKLTNDLPKDSIGRIAVDISSVDTTIVYALIESKKTALYRSKDKGESWEEMNKTGVVKERPFYFCYIVADPVDTNRIYKPGLQLSVSDNGGKTFDSGNMMSFGGGVHPDLHALWINPKNNNELYLGTDGGVYISNDKGASWRIVRNLPLSQFYHVSTDMEKPYNVYGGLQDNGSWYGPSASPGGIQNANWENVGGGDGFYVFADPDDPNIIYSQSQGGNINRLYLKTNESKTIKPIAAGETDKLRFNWNTPVAFGEKSDAMFIGTQYLYRSYDRGDSWERISPDLTTNDPEKQKQDKSGGVTIDNTSAENHCTIITINESPLDENIIWVGTDDGNLQVTTDGGKNWTDVTGNIPNLPECTWCSYVEPGRFEKGTVYVTFDGHRSGDMTPYVYKSTNYGKSWKSLATGNLTSYCHVIKQDLVNPDLLFLGTEFGLFVTIDDGSVWSQFTGNLPNVSTRDMVFQKRENDLVLATHGRGIMIIDDITPLDIFLRR
ncbi:Ycf48-like protein [subsurface metagenome]